MSQHESPGSQKEIVPKGDQWVRIPQGYEAVVEHDEPQEEKHLWDFLLMLWQRRWVLLGSFLVCVVPAVLYLRHNKPVLMYQATAQLRIGSENAVMASLSESPNSQGITLVDPLDTQIEILQSGRLISGVIEEMAKSDAAKMAKGGGAPSAKQPQASSDPSILERIQEAFDRGQEWLTGPPQQVREPKDMRSAQMQARADNFRRGLKLMKLPGTQIIELTYVSSDPDRSADVLNLLCEEFKKYEYQSKSDSLAEARSWLENRISDVKTTLTLSETALLGFTGGNSDDFMALATNGSDYQQKLDATETKLAGIEDEYATLKYEYDKLKSGTPPDLVLSDAEASQAASLRAKLDQYDIQRVESGLGPRMSQSKELEAAREKVSEQLNAELARIRSKVEMDFTRVSAERDRLEASLTEQQSRVVNLQSKLSRYNILKRDVEINKQMLDNFVQKWKVIGLSQGMNASNVSILQSAVPPLSPLPSNQNRVLMVSIVLGLGLGIGLVFFLNYMDVSFRTPEEIARIFHLPVMASIPYCAFGRRLRREVRPELVTHQRPYSGFADCYRGLRTTVQYAVGNGKCRKFIVSSALPSEGKTTVASNLAVSFAQKGCRTLLIDADLKDPSLHHVFGVKVGPGITNLLTAASQPGKGGDGADSPIMPTEVPNLYLLTAGPKVPNPVDLLESKAMREFLEDTERNYDYVVIDSAPIIDIADTSVLGPYVDGLVFVMRPGKTPRRLACEAKDKLMGMGTRVLGVVANYPTRSLQKRYNHSFGRYGFGSYGTRGYGRQRGWSRIDEQIGDPVVPAARFLLPPGKSS